MTAPPPLPFDRRGHLAQLAVQAVLASLAYVTRSWVPLATAALIFGISATWWTRGALVLRVHGWAFGLRGVAQLDDPRPARISTGLAALNFAGAAATVASGLAPELLWPGMLVLAAVLMAEAAFAPAFPANSSCGRPDAGS